METEFKAKLIDIFEIEDRSINFQDTFRDYPEWSSLTYLSLIAFFDQEYNIQIEEEYFNKLITIEDLYNAIK